MHFFASLSLALALPAADAQGPVQGSTTTVTVIAQKEPADPSRLPVSVSFVPAQLLAAAGVVFISDAALFSPNTHFTEFTARKLSNPRIRGIGASPANPGVVTYVDGVPHFNANTTSFDLIDTAQVEFVRGPQSALFGRNALGGVINVSSALPSLSRWGGEFLVPFGTDSLLEFRGGIGGPVVRDRLAVGFAFSAARRDGYTTNVLTGNDVDFRDGFTAQGQVLWTPHAAWETRLIVRAERARDGDYALNDLDAVRATPFEVARDFEGRTEREFVQTTLQARYLGARINFTNTIGILNWDTFDTTDLDYTPFPLTRRENREGALQFTNEARLASRADRPVRLGEESTLRWQTGVLAFTQGYDQLAVNHVAPFVISPFIDFPVSLTSPRAALDDRGVGVYGQATLALGDRVEVSAGARFDHERRQADLLTSASPMISPDVALVTSRDFNDVSPQIAAAYRFNPQAIAYATFSRAFKAGGFNPLSLPGSESYDEEHARNIEAGLKFSSDDGRYGVSAAVFSIDWDDLQLNLAIPFAPGAFFIDNVGAASSRGVEFEATARPMAGLDFFANAGFTRARFAGGTVIDAVDVSDNRIPNTPAWTAGFGAQYARTVRQHELFGRVDVGVTGAFQYDEANTAGQGAYALANFRMGMRMSYFTVEAWVRNAFDTRYVPLAFAFPGLNPSGFLAEPGRPRTFGVTVGVRY